MNKTTKNNKLFMAFGTGRESTEAASIKRYIGVAPVFVLGVNPTKKELESIFERDIEQEIAYVSETTIDGKAIKQARIDFIVKTDKDVCGVELLTKISFFLNQDMQYTKDASKIQVINKYGETTWLPGESIKTGVVPDNLSWFDTTGMRPAYVGEEALIHFIKTYLNIPNKSYTKKTGEVVLIDNPADAEAQLDNIEKYFKGDFSELQTIIGLQPKNKLKCVFGIKTTDDNKQYQAIYTRKFIKNNVSDYSKIASDIEEKQANGAYKDTIFETCPLKEYVIEKTDFSSVESMKDLPFGNVPAWGAQK
jgi:hypothetical protein